MPGLIRAAARTAVIAGTATSVSNRVSRRQANRWAQESAQQQPQPQYAQPQSPQPQPQPQYAAPQAAPAAASTDEVIAQLTQLGQLRDQGVLTEQEFAAQKAKILGS